MPLALWLIVVNVLTFAAFGYDKAQARRDGPRTPEKTLLTLALLGGWPGAKLAQRYFRHKTQKQPFGKLLNAALVVQILAVVAWFSGVLPPLN